jgi:hypothetical protein
VITASHDEVDLERREQAEGFLAEIKPDVVVVAAGTKSVKTGNHANFAPETARGDPLLPLHHRPTLFLYKFDRLGDNPA